MAQNTQTQPQTPPATTPPATAKKPRKPVRDLSQPIPGLDLNASLVEPGQEWTRPETKTVSRAAKPRSAQQLKLDAQAKDLHERWVKAGKPRDMEKSPKAEYHVAPEHVEAMTALLRKTADKAGGAPGRSIKIRQAPHPSGKTAVTVAVWDRLPGEKK